MMTDVSAKNIINRIIQHQFFLKINVNVSWLTSVFVKTDVNEVMLTSVFEKPMLINSH